MAVRCMACGRLSRDETVCEWCQAEISPAARAPVAASATEATATEANGDSLEIAPASPGPATAAAQETGIADGVAEALPESGSREAEAAENGSPEGWIEPASWHWDNDTRVILALIAIQFVLTLYLGRLSSWWSVTGFLWLAVGYGVIERVTWSLVLPLVLFTLDVALLLFGIGPRQRAGFISLAPLDFFLYLLRLVIWVLIFRLREEMD